MVLERLVAYGLLCLATFALADRDATGTTYIFADVESGTLRGQMSTYSRKFLGVPYAMPPLGDRRWRAPTKIERWNGTRDALGYATDCPQKDNMFIKLNSEDCLYLNIFAPANFTEPMPVMVFIHGGAYESGGSSVPIYSGEYLVRLAKVVLVTFNYRIGSLGILKSRNADASFGNYGLQDQRLVLEWVKTNIAVFGGDPKRVMIFGESAGAGSISAHTLSPKSAGLFNTAVMESGGYSIWSAVRAANAEAAFEKFAKNTGCGSSGDIVACMLALPVDKILEAQFAMTITSASLNWAPVVDGVDLPDWPETMASEGKFSNKGPVIAGTNSAEAYALVYALVGPTLNETTYKELVRLLFGTAAGLIQFAYPASDYPTPWWAFEAIITDALFACPARRMVRWLTHYEVPSYLYSFAHTPAVTVIPDCYAPCHTVELPYVFHVQPMLSGTAESAFSTSMVAYWSTFAANFRPNPPGLPEWPLYGRWTDKHLILNETISSSSGLRVKQCNFWDLVQKIMPTYAETARKLINELTNL